MARTCIALVEGVCQVGREIDDPVVVGGPDRLRSVADRFWALAHDSYTGRCHLHADHLGLGLAGALLAELLLADFLWMATDGSLRPTYPRAYQEVPADPVGHRLMQLVKNEPRMMARRWLEYLALDAEDRVRERLLDAGLLIAVGKRLRSRRWEAVDPTVLSYQAQHLAQRLREATSAVSRVGESHARHSRPSSPEVAAAEQRQAVGIAVMNVLTPADVVLIALVDATDLAGSLQRTTTSPINMPAWLWEIVPTPYKQLISSLHHAIGVSVTGRR